MSNADTRLLEDVARRLESCLPDGWALSLLPAGTGSPPRLRVRAANGVSRDVPLSIHHRFSPRVATALPQQTNLIVIAPYISAAAREALERLGLCYADPTGNLRVSLDEPALFVLRSGADTNPNPERRQLSLRGTKAGRLVSALIAARPPIGVRQLAELAGIDAGYVSRLIKLLDSAALVDRAPRGPVEHVHWRRLLARWATDAPLDRRAVITTWLAPRGLSSLQEQLSDSELRYLITGSAAAARIAPVAPPRLLSVYVDTVPHAAEALGLRKADAGANVILLQPEDASIFENITEADGGRWAPLPLLVIDLLNGPGRSPAEAEALMDWMEQHPEAWRG